MTDGHNHREVRIDPSSRFGGAIQAWLVKPRRHFAVVPHTPAWDRIDRSKIPYGPCRDHYWDDGKECYYLSILGVLHRWTGLTLYVQSVPDE